MHDKPTRQEEQQLLDAFRTLSAKQKAMLFDLMARLAQREKDEKAGKNRD